MSPQPPDSLGLKLWVVLSRAHAAVEAHAREDFARRGLSPAEFGALEALYHKGPLLLGDLQRKTLVTSGGMTYVVDRLVARGYVERVRCPSDRRASFASLTEAGTQYMDEIFREHQSVIERAVSGIDDDMKPALIESLKKLGFEAVRLAQESAQSAKRESGARHPSP
jgi:MarR family transcriptional regulator, 2-MHQ and catechol-resistance regulon repressor